MGVMMKFLFRKSREFVADTSGAAIVEYGLALLVVASISIAAFTFLSTQTNTNVGTACTALGSATC